MPDLVNATDNDNDNDEDSDNNLDEEY
jgi:hypothetical protein